MTNTIMMCGFINFARDAHSQDEAVSSLERRFVFPNLYAIDSNPFFFGSNLSCGEHVLRRYGILHVNLVTGPPYFILAILVRRHSSSTKRASETNLCRQYLRQVFERIQPTLALRLAAAVNTNVTPDCLTVCALLSQTGWLKFPRENQLLIFQGSCQRVHMVQLRFGFDLVDVAKGPSPFPQAIWRMACSLGILFRTTGTPRCQRTPRAKRCWSTFGTRSPNHPTPSSRQQQCSNATVTKC